MKQCKQCLEIKPIEEFYKAKNTRDGHLGKCKRCISDGVIANRNQNIEHYREYDRKRGNRQPPEYLTEYRAKYPNKYRAHNIVNNALRDGKLRKEPCVICKETSSVHAHHDDYAWPLNVRWLCSAHHSQWHRDHGEGLNP